MKFNETCAEVKSITNTFITFECVSSSFNDEGSNPIGGEVWLSLLNERLDKGLFEQCTQWIQMKIQMVDQFI